MRVLGDLTQIDIGRQGHSPGMDSKNLQTRLIVGNSNFDFAIEAAGTSQGGIQNLRNVGRTNHDHLATRDKTVHQAEKLSDHALLDFAGDLGTFRGNSVDFVNKEDGWSVAGGLVKDLAQLGLA